MSTETILNLKMYYSRLKREVDCFVFHIADIGADILDLAETMITSNGLQYEPVREAHLYTNRLSLFSFCDFPVFQKVLSPFVPDHL